MSETLKQSLQKIKNDSEIAVREGSTTLILSDKNISEKKS